jgi:glutathione synthase/RimK-type ligase-like ATP-grasp enzyme
MRELFVVNRDEEWPFEVTGTGSTTARSYLTNSETARAAEVQVINLCGADGYQGQAYYVSLLAEARGHRPLPDVKTIEDLQSEDFIGKLSDDLGSLVETVLGNGNADRAEIDAYFGRSPADVHAALTQRLFTLVPAPLLRASFQRADGRWHLRSLRAMGAGDVPREHRAFLLGAATEYITGRRTPTVAGSDAAAPPRLAILHDAQEVDRPSNPRALRSFVDAARVAGLEAELVTADAVDRLAEFDALFIRTTTNVEHYTYEFSRRASALGLVVIDDPDSILKCNNKVYLHELMTRHGVPTPKTVMVHAGNLDTVAATLGLPLILKEPDGGFGLGVSKMETEPQFLERAKELLARSELLIAQQWLPTELDWRVCVLDRRPLFVCKYFMAPGHWQVIKRATDSRVEGRTVALPVGEAPEIVVQTALRGANLIGGGLYGVDLKLVGAQCYLIEVNDNPNIDAGNEDQILGSALYREVIGVFARRIRERRKTVVAQ